MSMEDWRKNLIDDDNGLASLLQRAKTIAVLGAKSRPSEPAYYVPAYLQARGYRILPVNPTIQGERFFGAEVVPRFSDLTEPADLIEVFRRPEFLPGHAEEILSLPWRPMAVWFQLGIRHEGAAERLARAGIQVVQDRCMMPEHRRLLGS